MKHAVYASTDQKRRPLREDVGVVEASPDVCSAPEVSALDVLLQGAKLDRDTCVLDGMTSRQVPDQAAAIATEVNRETITPRPSKHLLVPNGSL